MTRQKQAITEKEEVTALGYIRHNGVLHDQHDTCPYCQPEKKADASREWAKSYERFRLFFIPAIDLDQVPPVKIYASEKDAWDCWKYFVQPLLEAQEQRVRREIKDKIIQFAIEGGAVPQELKGLQLYTKIMNYLSDRPEKE